METISERENSFFGSGFLFVATGTSESGVEFVFVQSVEQSLGLHQVGMNFTAMRKRPYTGFVCFFIVFYD